MLIKYTCINKGKEAVRFVKTIKANYKFRKLYIHEVNVFNESKTCTPIKLFRNIIYIKKLKLYAQFSVCNSFWTLCQAILLS